jgi:hypothetical protein
VGEPPNPALRPTNVDDVVLNAGPPNPPLLPGPTPVNALANWGFGGRYAFEGPVGDPPNSEFGTRLEYPENTIHTHIQHLKSRARTIGNTKCRLLVSKTYGLFVNK